MILIGLTGWGDHEELYTDAATRRNKLQTYSTFFSIVEIDSSFYAIQPTKNYQKWAGETPEGFSFIVKAYQGMTGHLRGKLPYQDAKSMFHAFADSILPLKEAGKLKAILFQYPPWFGCTKENVDLLRYTRDRMLDWPVAIEFRNDSWFTCDMEERTLSFLKQEGWIHSICDEPQVAGSSVPIVLTPTNPDLTLVRFHGRNAAGWRNQGKDNWREVRYLYDYTEVELLEWKERLEYLKPYTKEIGILFNNNSGGHAASNAKTLMRLMGWRENKVKKSSEEQLKLFE
jgi:uncharacterized protein YecE (DUF72 family)